MLGLVPGVHVFPIKQERRGWPGTILDKPGHDARMHVPMESGRAPDSSTGEYSYRQTSCQRTDVHPASSAGQVFAGTQCLHL